MYQAREAWLSRSNAATAGDHLTKLLNRGQLELPLTSSAVEADDKLV
jgi:hypothetical protein